ncbi:MAG: putative membrane protein [Thermodesulfobacterium sp.]|uniref:Membrane protein n=1 Tax=Candidatus Thermodesulfobacterium syntrophicum TaxID=3060442 RepID=A0AAE3P4V5_9BACT|nr:putative membrane protein [Candidatus Thermodesulfobacterium syntrophicum]
MAKTSIGLEENVAGLLCYLLGWITGIIFLILEKESKFVRFHAIQSIATFLPLMIISWIFIWIPFIGIIISWFCSLLGLILWIILMIKAYQGEMYELPIVGEFAKEKVQ